MKEIIKFILELQVIIRFFRCRWHIRGTRLYERILETVTLIEVDGSLKVRLHYGLSVLLVS